MAAYLVYGVQGKPTQTTNVFQEFVKHFESVISFDDLQIQINDFLLLLGSPAIENQPAIKSIRFQNIYKVPPDAGFYYYAQVHYVLTGDAPNIP